MSSIVAICNLALSNIGKENITSLTEASTEARACRQFYDHTLGTLLQAYPWRFAGKTVALAEVANDRAGRWAHAYQRPSDCLKIRSIGAGDYDAEAGLIYADASPAVLTYTAQIEDPSRFPPLFADALSWHLAVRLAMPMTRDPKIRADAWQVAQQMTGLAQMADANEVRENSDIDSDLVASRDGVAGYCRADATASGSVPAPVSPPETETGTPFDFVTVYEQAKQ